MRRMLLVVALFAAYVATARAEEQNWQIAGDLYLGSMVPFGTEKEAGVAMGGKAGTRYESDGRAVLIYGELMGEGFNNGDTSKDIQFSQFYLNTGLMLGAKAVKWKTPVNVNLSRDTVSNEDFTVRYAFSGLYVKFIDDKDPANKVGEDELKQVLETYADFVVAHINYMTGWQQPYEPCYEPDRGACPVQPPSQYESGRTILGLYAAIKYEIEKRGWGSAMKVELLQDLSPTYTKATASLVGYKQLSGDLKNLRPFVEVAGVIDHDRSDPEGTLQGAIRIFGGIGGRFGM